MADPNVITGFAIATRDALRGKHLSYSDRMRLLNRAEHLGIQRFDANLIIAMVQHRAVDTPCAIQSQRRWPSRLAGLGIAMMVQSVIIAGAWWILR